MKLTVKRLRELLSDLPDDFTIAASSEDGSFDVGGIVRDDENAEIELIDTEHAWIEATRKMRDA